jgi:hypothetical protein
MDYRVKPGNDENTSRVMTTIKERSIQRAAKAISRDTLQPCSLNHGSSRLDRDAALVTNLAFPACCP